MAIDYTRLLENAMRTVVRDVLTITAKQGMVLPHHFYLSFVTYYAGVILSDKLRARYPEEMTIVLQHQFAQLEVTERAFSVTLNFDGVSERITVPFSAMTAFSDPSENFGVHFHVLDQESASGEGGIAAASAPATTIPSASSTVSESTSSPGTPPNNVIALDKFRKK
jgi:hypothetical protein